MDLWDDSIPMMDPVISISEWKMELADVDNCHELLHSITEILNDLNLFNALLVFDPNGCRQRHTISW